MRSFATALVVVYFATNCAWAHKPATSVWDERRQITSIPQIALPLALASRSALESRSASADPSFDGALMSAGDSKAERDALQELIQFGSVRRITNHQSLPLRQGYGGQASTKSKTIIHIQDVHQNLEAQKNISAAISALAKQKKISVLALEGAAGAIDLSAFKEFPYPQYISESVESLFETGEITGAMHAVLRSQFSVLSKNLRTNLLRTENFPVVGVDDAAHYQANVNAYRQSMAGVKTEKAKLEAWEKELAQRKFSVLSSQLAAFDAKVEAYRDGKISMGDYAETVCRREAEGRGDLAMFIEALKLERSLNFSRVESERARLLSDLVRKMDKAANQQLIDAGLAYRAGKITHANFYALVKRLCDQNGLTFARYPAMDDYLRYVLLADQIDAEKLFAEVRAAEDAMYASLAQTPAQRALVAESRRAYLVGKLLDFALTKQEWNEYKEVLSNQFSVLSEKPSLRTNSLRTENFQNFYKEAEIRDAKMAENLLSSFPHVGGGNLGNGVAVLVTGGFHSQGIDDRLARAGYTVITFVPRITKADTEDGSAYLSVFAQERTPLEQLFQGDKLFLSRPQMPAALRQRIGLGATAKAATQPSFDETAWANRFLSSTAYRAAAVISFFGWAVFVLKKQAGSLAVLAVRNGSFLAWIIGEEIFFRQLLIGTLGLNPWLVGLLFLIVHIPKTYVQALRETDNGKSGSVMGSFVRLLTLRSAGTTYITVAYVGSHNALLAAIAAHTIFAVLMKIATFIQPFWVPAHLSLEPETEGGSKPSSMTAREAIGLNTALEKEFSDMFRSYTGFVTIIGKERYATPSPEARPDLDMAFLGVPINFDLEEKSTTPKEETPAVEDSDSTDDNAADESPEDFYASNGVDDDDQAESDDDKGSEAAKQDARSYSAEEAEMEAARQQALDESRKTAVAELASRLQNKLAQFDEVYAAATLSGVANSFRSTKDLIGQHGLAIGMKNAGNFAVALRSTDENELIGTYLLRFDANGKIPGIACTEPTLAGQLVVAKAARSGMHMRLQLQLLYKPGTDPKDIFQFLPFLLMEYRHKREKKFMPPSEFGGDWVPTLETITKFVMKSPAGKGLDIVGIIRHSQAIHLNIVASLHKKLETVWAMLEQAGYDFSIEVRYIDNLAYVLSRARQAPKPEEYFNTIAKMSFVAVVSESSQVIIPNEPPLTIKGHPGDAVEVRVAGSKAGDWSVVVTAFPAGDRWVFPINRGWNLLDQGVFMPGVRPDNPSEEGDNDEDSSDNVSSASRPAYQKDWINPPQSPGARLYFDLYNGLDLAAIEEPSSEDLSKDPFQRRFELDERYGLTFSLAEWEHLYSSLQLKNGDTVLQIHPRSTVFGFALALGGAAVDVYEQDPKNFERLQKVQAQLAEKITAAGGRINLHQADVLSDDAQKALEGKRFRGVIATDVLVYPRAVGSLHPLYSSFENDGVRGEQVKSLLDFIVRHVSANDGAVFASFLDSSLRHRDYPITDVLKREKIGQRMYQSVTAATTQALQDRSRIRKPFGGGFIFRLSPPKKPMNQIWGEAFKVYDNLHKTLDLVAIEKSLGTPDSPMDAATLDTNYGFTLSESEIARIFKELYLRSGDRLLQIRPRHTVLCFVAALSGARVTVYEPNEHNFQRLQIIHGLLEKQISDAGGEFDLKQGDVLDTRIRERLRDQRFRQILLLDTLVLPKSKKKGFSGLYDSVADSLVTGEEAEDLMEFMVNHADPAGSHLFFNFVDATLIQQRTNPILELLQKRGLLFSSVKATTPMTSASQSHKIGSAWHPRGVIAHVSPSSFLYRAGHPIQTFVGTFIENGGFIAMSLLAQNDWRFLAAAIVFKVIYAGFHAWRDGPTWRGFFTHLFVFLQYDLLLFVFSWISPEYGAFIGTVVPALNHLLWDAFVYVRAQIAAIEQIYPQPKSLSDFYAWKLRVNASPDVELGNLALMTQHELIRRLREWAARIETFDAADPFLQRHRALLRNMSETLEKAVLSDVAPTASLQFHGILTRFKAEFAKNNIFKNGGLRAWIETIHIASPSIQKFLRDLLASQNDILRLQDNYLHLYEGDQSSSSGATNPAVDLNDLIDRAIADDGTRVSQYAHVSLKTNFGRIPPIVCDIPRLTTAIQEATRNAVYSTLITVESGSYLAYQSPNGRPKVSVKTEFLPKSKSARITIEDNGIGMSKDTARAMRLVAFTSGSQFGNKGIGTGLIDLAVRDHGGTWRVESEKGKGTKVIIDLPVRPRWVDKPLASNTFLKKITFGIVVVFALEIFLVVAYQYFAVMYPIRLAHPWALMFMGFPLEWAGAFIGSYFAQIYPNWINGSKHPFDVWRALRQTKVSVLTVPVVSFFMYGWLMRDVVGMMVPSVFHGLILSAILFPVLFDPVTYLVGRLWVERPEGGVAQILREAKTKMLPMAVRAITVGIPSHTLALIVAATVDPVLGFAVSRAGSVIWQIVFADYLKKKTDDKPVPFWGERFIPAFWLNTLQRYYQSGFFTPIVLAFTFVIYPTGVFTRFAYLNPPLLAWIAAWTIFGIAIAMFLISHFQTRVTLTLHDAEAEDITALAEIDAAAKRPYDLASWTKAEFQKRMYTNGNGRGSIVLSGQRLSIRDIMGDSVRLQLKPATPSGHVIVAVDQNKKVAGFLVWEDDTIVNLEVREGYNERAVIKKLMEQAFVKIQGDIGYAFSERRLSSRAPLMLKLGFRALPGIENGIVRMVFKGVPPAFAMMQHVGKALYWITSWKYLVWLTPFVPLIAAVAEAYEMKTLAGALAVTNNTLPFLSYIPLWGWALVLIPSFGFAFGFVDHRFVFDALKRVSFQRLESRPATTQEKFWLSIWGMAFIAPFFVFDRDTAFSISAAVHVLRNGWKILRKKGVFAMAASPEPKVMIEWRDQLTMADLKTLIESQRFNRPGYSETERWDEDRFREDLGAMRVLAGFHNGNLVCFATVMPQRGRRHLIENYGVVSAYISTGILDMLIDELMERHLTRDGKTTLEITLPKGDSDIARFIVRGMRRRPNSGNRVELVVSQKPTFKPETENAVRWLFSSGIENLKPTGRMHFRRLAMTDSEILERIESEKNGRNLVLWSDQEFNEYLDIAPESLEVEPINAGDYGIGIVDDNDDVWGFVLWDQSKLNSKTIKITNIGVRPGHFHDDFMRRLIGFVQNNVASFERPIVEYDIPTAMLERQRPLFAASRFGVSTEKLSQAVRMAWNMQTERQMFLALGNIIGQMNWLSQPGLFNQVEILHLRRGEFLKRVDAVADILEQHALSGENIQWKKNQLETLMDVCATLGIRNRLAGFLKHQPETVVRAIMSADFKAEFLHWTHTVSRDDLPALVEMQYLDSNMLHHAWTAEEFERESRNGYVWVGYMDRRPVCFAVIIEDTIVRFGARPEVEHEALEALLNKVTDEYFAEYGDELIASVPKSNISMVHTFQTAGFVLPEEAFDARERYTAVLPLLHLTATPASVHGNVLMQDALSQYAPGNISIRPLTSEHLADVQGIYREIHGTPMDLTIFRRAILNPLQNAEVFLEGPHLAGAFNDEGLLLGYLVWDMELGRGGARGVFAMAEMRTDYEMRNILVPFLNHLKKDAGASHIRFNIPVQRRNSTDLLWHERMKKEILRQEGFSSDPNDFAQNIWEWSRDQQSAGVSSVLRPLLQLLIAAGIWLFALTGNAPAYEGIQQPVRSQPQIVDVLSGSPTNLGLRHMNRAVVNEAAMHDQNVLVLVVDREEDVALAQGLIRMAAFQKQNGVNIQPLVAATPAFRGAFDKNIVLDNDALWSARDGGETLAGSVLEQELSRRRLLDKNVIMVTRRGLSMELNGIERLREAIRFYLDESLSAVREKLGDVEDRLKAANLPSTQL